MIKLRNFLMESTDISTLSKIIKMYKEKIINLEHHVELLIKEKQEKEKELEVIGEVIEEEKELEVIEEVIEEEKELEVIGEDLATNCSSSQSGECSVFNNSENLEKMVNQLIKTSNKKEAKKEVIENVPRIKLLDYIQSDAIYSIIYGATQIGKSENIQRVITVCRSEEIPIIISCDNREDQKVQIMDRLKAYPENIGLEFIEANKIGNMRKQLKKCFEQNKIFVLVCLNNNSQINKMNKVFNEMKKDIKMKKLMIIHDEGDLIAKNDDTENISDSQKVSHKAWIKFVEFLKTILDPKIIFVTATPENCTVLYKVQNTFVFKIKAREDYTGYEKINFIDKDTEEEDILDKEVSRIKESGEPQAILYIVDRLVQNQEEGCISTFSDQFPDVVVHTYNGKGILAYSKNPLFEEYLKGYNYKKERLRPFVYKIKGMRISSFYDICQSMGEKVVITIGMNLINRGISFVSSYYEKPLAATTMIFQPGSSLPAVSIAQVIGRILGRARPDLERRLYCSGEVFDTYIKYNKNQEEWLQKIQSEQTGYTKDIIVANKPSHFYKRNTDRPELHLNTIFKGEKEERTRVSDSDPDHMKHLINMWWPAQTIIGKVLKFVYEKETVPENQLKEFIQECGSINTVSQINELIRKDNKYYLVFKRTGTNTKITKEAREYIKEKFDN